MAPLVGAVPGRSHPPFQPFGRGRGRPRLPTAVDATEEDETMKRYQKLLGPIVLGLCAWGVVLGFCAKSGECADPVRDVIGAVREAGAARCVRENSVVQGTGSEWCVLFFNL